MEESDGDDVDESDVSASDEEDEDGWEGVSGDEHDNNVEVIEYKDARLEPDAKMDKKARKAFMVCIKRIRSPGFILTCTYCRTQNRRPP